MLPGLMWELMQKLKHPQVIFRGERMKSKYLAIVCVTLILLTGCSREDDSRSTIAPEESVFKDHINALEKSKGVEQMMLEGAETRDQMMEEQTK